jgi:hypothetical protein
MGPGYNLLRYSLGIVYFHFGLLKFFSDLSSAELLAEQTIMKLSFYMIDAHTAILFLAILEVLIGLGFLFRIKLKWVFYLFLVHMAGTFIPLFAIPEIVYKVAPFAPTIEGQYILKNIVFIAAGWAVLYPHVKHKRETRKILDL